MRVVLTIDRYKNHELGGDVGHSIAGNVLRLGVVAVFTTNVDTKHTLQIYEKQSYEARHPPLRQTAPMFAKVYI